MIQSSETCFVGLDLKVEPWWNSDDTANTSESESGTLVKVKEEPWWNSDDTANASERQLDGEVLDGEWVSDLPAGNLTRSVGSRNIDIKPHLERICR